MSYSDFAIPCYTLSILVFAALPAIANQSDAEISTDGQHNRQDVPEHIKTEQALQIDESFFLSDQNNAGVHFTADILEYDEQEFEIIQDTEYVPGIRSIHAQSTDEPSNYILFSIREDGSLFGQAVMSDQNTSTEYTLTTDHKSDRRILRHVAPDHDPTLECGIEMLQDHEYSALNGFETDAAESAVSNSTSPHVMASDDVFDDQVVIDMLIAYTPAAATWADTTSSDRSPGDIELLIAETMNISQQALDNSNIGIDLRLVDFMKVDYDESDAAHDGDEGSSVMLRQLTARPDDFDDFRGYFDEVHQRREDTGADLVALLPFIDDTGGIAWLPRNPSGSPHRGFSITRVQQAAISHTMIHEIGHNAGLAHARNQSSAEAGAVGGMFEYSTGWRWPNDEGDTLASVMAYPEGGLRVPAFSSPEIIVNGQPTGTYSGEGAPADNVRSLNEIKYVLSSYRPAFTDSPMAIASANQISTSVSRDGENQEALTLSNTGDTQLQYQLDFIPDETDPPLARRSDTDSQADQIDFKKDPESHGGNHNQRITRDEQGYLINTGFTESDGFALTSAAANNEWKSMNSLSDVEFEITNDNPSTGNNHLRMGRISSRDSGAGLGVESPFFGLRPYGSFELSFDISISAEDGAGYWVTLVDNRNQGAEVAAIHYSSNGGIFVAEVDQSGEQNFEYVGENWSPGVYNSVEISLDADAGEIQYYLDGMQIYTTSMLEGKAPGRMRLIHNNNQQPGEVVDLDNVSYRIPHTGLSWIDPQQWAGTIAPDNDQEITLSVSGKGLESDSYSGTMLIYTNDPDAPRTPTRAPPRRSRDRPPSVR